MNVPSDDIQDLAPDSEPPTDTTEGGLADRGSASVGKIATSASGKPAWVQFLATAIRLFDAHDLRRTPGAEHISLADDTRRGSSDGRFVSIAWSLLEYLRDRELEGALDFIALTDFIDESSELFGVSKQDVQYIIVLLAAPTKLSFVDHTNGFTRYRATTETALIEKQRRGYACRLTIGGREALGFASGYFKWVHAGVESKKLLVDLKSNDFASFYQVAIRLLDRIRQEGLEVRRALERPEVADMRRYFLEHADRYTSTIEEVLTVTNDAQVLLGTKDVLDAFDQHMTKASDGDSLSPTLFNDLIRNILNALGSLQRLFSQFIQDVQKRDRALIGIVRFDEMAQNLAKMPVGPATDPEFLEGMFRGIGPLRADVPGFTPLELHRTIEIKRPKEKRVAGFRKMGAPILVLDRVEKFVARNRELLLERLRKGPLSLTEMLEDNDFLDPRDLDYLAEITALIVSPLILKFDDIDNVRIRLTIGDQKVWLLDDGWEISGTEFTMGLEEKTDGF
jgi:hypothetical protein